MGLVAAQLERAFPIDNAHVGATVNRLHDEIPSEPPASLPSSARRRACY
jgi:hypothetical protein